MRQNRLLILQGTTETQPELFDAGAALLAFGRRRDLFAAVGQRVTSLLDAMCGDMAKLLGDVSGPPRGLFSDMLGSGASVAGQQAKKQK